MSSLPIRISAELRKELQLLGKKQHRPISELVRDSLRQYVAQEQLRLIRQKRRPFAQAKGLLTDKDILKHLQESSK